MTLTRPAAYPLITHDPYFSVWAMTDKLPGENLRHWTGSPMHLEIEAEVDGHLYVLAGTYSEGEPAVQERFMMDAMSTIFVLRAGEVSFELRFTSPLLLDDLDLLARPLSYLTVRTQSLDRRRHDVHVNVRLSDSFCLDHPGSEDVMFHQYDGPNFASIAMGSVSQHQLTRAGDDLRIEWGEVYLSAEGRHVLQRAIPRQKVVPVTTPTDLAGPATSGSAGPNTFAAGAAPDTVGTSVNLGTSANPDANGTSGTSDNPGTTGTPEDPDTAANGTPGSPAAPKSRTTPDPGTLSWIAVEADLSGKDEEVVYTVAYDDHRGLSWFGEPLRSYWQRGGATIRDIIALAHAEYDDIMARCDAASEALYDEAFKAGGEAYAELCVLTYRQSIAAHKLALSPDDEIFFISKENFSNGCAATVDVSYPSVPLYLRYNPELVGGMLRPIFRYASSDRWRWPFAPHDVGTYPLLHGQVYGGKDGEDLRYQMPVEECGNMLIMTAAYLDETKDIALIRDNLDLLLQWAEYLADFGIDPGDQLCTDDFAGHLARNANLAAKAIMGLAAMGRIAAKLAKQGDLRSRKAWFDAAKDWHMAARDFAEVWRRKARNLDGTYMLSYDRPGSWSLKYNLVWDLVFRTRLFPAATLEAEARAYPMRLQRYGVPLDIRSTYTKADWEIWAGCLTAIFDPDGFERITEAMILAYSETEQRVPMTDWYDTVTADKQGFQARSVVGGIFMKMYVEAKR